MGFLQPGTIIVPETQVSNRDGLSQRELPSYCQIGVNIACITTSPADHPLLLGNR